MAQTSEAQVVDILTPGMRNFANVTGDNELLQGGAMFYREVKDVFIENVRPSDTCSFAFLSMVVLPEIRVECFVAVLTDRVIVAWRKGIFKKTTVSKIIPKQAITQVSWGIADRRSPTPGAALMTIVPANDRPIAIAMPKGQPAAADAIVSAVRAR